MPLVLGLGQLGLVWSFVIGRGKARAGHFSAPVQQGQGAAASVAASLTADCHSLSEMLNH